MRIILIPLVLAVAVVVATLMLATAPRASVALPVDAGTTIVDQ